MKIKVVLLLIVKCYCLHTLRGQNVNQVLKHVPKGNSKYETKMQFSPTYYRLDEDDIAPLKEAQELMKGVEKLELFFGKYLAGDLGLSKDGERYFEDLFARYFYRLYRKSIHNGFNYYFLKYPFLEPTSPTLIRNRQGYNRYFRDVVTKDITENMLFNSSMLYDCELFDEIKKNPFRVAHLRKTVKGCKHLIQKRRKKASKDDECILKNTKFLLKILDKDYKFD